MGSRLDGGTAGLRKAEHLGDLVEGFADRIVHRRAQTIVDADVLDRENLGVAAGSHQQRDRETPIAARSRAHQRVRLEVVDRRERLARRQRDSLAGHQADQHAADQAGSGRGGHAVEVVGRELRPLQRARDELVDDLDMGSRGDFRNDAAIGGMRGDLAHHLVGEDFARAVGPQPHDGGCGFVAGRLNAKNAHV